MKRYHFECGCWINEESVIKRKNRHLCPEHREKVVEIEIECLDCGKVMIVGPRSSMVLRCRECKILLDRERNRKAWSSRARKPGRRGRPNKRKCKVCGRQTAYLNRTGQCYHHDLAPDTDNGRAWFADHPWEYIQDAFYMVDPDGEDYYADEKGGTHDHN